MKTSQFTLEILLGYQISLIPFEMTSITRNNIIVKEKY